MASDHNKSLAQAIHDLANLGRLSDESSDAVDHLLGNAPHDSDKSQKDKSVQETQAKKVEPVAKTDDTKGSK